MYLQVAILGGSDEHMTEVAFQYGRNIGLAFQLVDDLLDFVSSADAMGKPTAADLKLGLATAPVLFACEKVVTMVYMIPCISPLTSTNVRICIVPRAEPNDYASLRGARRC